MTNGLVAYQRHLSIDFYIETNDVEESLDRS